MDMGLNNRLTKDETSEQVHDIFLELTANSLDPADILLFNLQFEERGGAELFDPVEDWQEHVDFDLNPDLFAEVVIGLADSEDSEISDVFTRILLCREKDHKLCHIVRREQIVAFGVKKGRQLPALTVFKVDRLSGKKRRARDSPSAQDVS